jgi:hypothetical protein
MSRHLAAFHLPSLHWPKRAWWWMTVLAIFEVSPAVSSRISFLWAVTLRRWVGGSRRFGERVAFFMGLQPLGAKATHEFETAGTTYPATQRHSPEDQNPWRFVLKNHVILPVGLISLLMMSRGVVERAGRMCVNVKQLLARGLQLAARCCVFTSGHLRPHWVTVFRKHHITVGGVFSARAALVRCVYVCGGGGDPTLRSQCKYSPYGNLGLSVLWACNECNETCRYIVNYEHIKCVY